MPDLKQSLHDHDFGHLRIVAEHWGIILTAEDARSALNELVAKMLQGDQTNEVLETLPEQAIHALETLRGKHDRMPWQQFTRQYGKVREMGPGRRDRERPDQNPVSTAEVLWYRGLVGRAFFDMARGAEEFAYIPTDLIDLIPVAIPTSSLSTGNTAAKVLGRAAVRTERAIPSAANDKILDHACTLLAALRTGEAIPDFTPISQRFIRTITHHAGILDRDRFPDPESTRTFLEASRGEALLILAQAWLNAADHNDLQYVPGLQVEGEWQNNPLATRQFLLDLFAVIPKDIWWSLPAFIADVHHHYPDFQRPAGDYDSWFIKDQQTGEYLRGFKHWFDIDGALIRYLITGPLHWLGIADLASPEEEQPATAFRRSKWADQLLAGLPARDLGKENNPVHVRSDGRISIPLLAPRAVRYQLARFCSWETGNIHEYRYRLTPSSLTAAQKAGLRTDHLISLLRRHAESIPPNILTALGRWNESGPQVRMQTATILRLGSPQILSALRTSRATRFLGDPLGSTAIIVKEGAEEKVLAALVEMGYFGEFQSDP